MSDLSVRDHDRDSTGMRYVYAVVSRRAGGVSVGINLNPNNACNWRCVYCQVPDLSRGAAPPIDLPRLERELRELLRDLVEGDFMERRVPEGARALRDLAFSGNGEPTSSPQLRDALDVAGRVRDEFGLCESLPFVLITNGSLVGRDDVGAALERLAELGGEVWFKLDAATDAGLRAVSSTAVRAGRHLERLRKVAALCPTRVQTCVFARGGEPSIDADAWVDALRTLVDEGVPLRGLLLYGLARPSLQPEAPELTALPAEWLEALAARVAPFLPVEVSP
jgi:wyosine [tRNA(Phe)-imidazoG37] synthetase (radical SAM superfamily)